MAAMNLDGVLEVATDTAGLVTFGTAPRLPSTANTYAPGCVLIVGGTLYYNKGTLATPDFVAVRTVQTQDVTATTDGTGTGQVDADTTFAVVTCDDANKIVTLPAPAVGLEVVLRNAGTGYELRTTDPTTIGINGGVGAAAESAIGTNVTVRCVCTTSTTWVCNNFSTAGAVTATQVAAA